MIIAVANFIVISYSQGTQKTDAAIIDTAGRQRMFSQQLAFYAERIVRGHTASKVTLKKVITLYQGYSLIDGERIPTHRFCIMAF